MTRIGDRECSQFLVCAQTDRVTRIGDSDRVPGMTGMRYLECAQMCLSALCLSESRATLYGHASARGARACNAGRRVPSRLLYPSPPIRVTLGGMPSRLPSMLSRPHRYLTPRIPPPCLRLYPSPAPCAASFVAADSNPSPQSAESPIRVTNPSLQSESQSDSPIQVTIRVP